MITIGEWLLIHHKEHTSRLKIIQDRIAQCTNALNALDENIEELSLRGASLSSVRSSAVPDPTSRIALENEKERMELESQLATLVMNERHIADYINVFTLILNSLSGEDRWFVENHYLKGVSVNNLTKMEPLSEDMPMSKSSLHRRQKDIIKNVTEICELINFRPEEYETGT